jgi:hypothetical protein
MKRFTVLLALFCVGLLAASFAAAEPPPGKDKGKGKKKTTTAVTLDPATCKPKVSAILKGTFVSGGGDSFTMDVKRSNYHARELVGEALTVMVDTKTRFVRRGPAELSDFETGDRLNVQARTCKQRKNRQPTANQALAPMLAKRVVGRPANPAETRGETTTTTATP